ATRQRRRQRSGRRHGWARRHRIRSVCTTWPASATSGAPTGTTSATTWSRRRAIRAARRRARGASVAAAPGATPIRGAQSHTARRYRPTYGTRTTGSGSRAPAVLWRRSPEHDFGRPLGTPRGHRRRPDRRRRGRDLVLRLRLRARPALPDPHAARLLR